eukprot:CAMPEP_0113412160 /NCGR_PEP_ID=MMETSP0013_2-20120614/22683_1 /TAXON_ID=2843 ORGANISM="Skeletonema costatum, Strain 1716" /NCGR_SAMPLE_ID=MMETSP0013_2 /ASSEMBLY_ACC=CAM_ASM_000158 /LENGTH=292 /DNA_ID=CAMNT_0000298627 /DNA_START=279 /DNA_END=1157 /DNA_ORIENTATION=- /assembly_acc=CAM_ASM_000158
MCQIDEAPDSVCSVNINGWACSPSSMLDIVKRHALLSLLCTYFSKKETTIPTSILHSLSTFLSRRYNLNSTPSNRDRTSLARDEAYSLKHIPAATTTASQSHQQQMVDNATASIEDGNDQLETTLEELEQTLTTCELSLDEFERKERFLYVRIEKYREMIRERECFIDSQEREQEIKGAASNDDNSVSASGEEETAGAVEEGEEATQDEEENNDNINNNNNNNPTQDQLIQLKHQQDQTNLQDVEAIHEDIIVQIETIKRRIIELADKKQDILKNREECHEFLVEFAEGNFE